MKTWMTVGAGLGLLMAGGVAMAQNAPPAPPPVAPAAGPMVQMDGGPQHDGPMRDGMMRGGMMRGGWGHMHGDRMEGHGPPPPPMTKAAMFRFRKGDASVFVKCAENEPTATCVDAASKLMDKLAAQPK